MKRILTILFLLVSLVSQGQYTKHVITSGTGYDRANGIAMAYLAHVPTANSNGNKHAAVIYLHGIDHRGARGDITTTNGIDRVALKGIPNLIRTSPLPMFTKPGGISPQDDYKYAVFAMQCSSEFGTWPVAYTAEMIKVIKANYANQVDTNMIMVVGYSLGAGGVTPLGADPFCSENISSIHAVAIGYIGSTNYVTMARSGPPFYSYFSTGDPLVSPSVPDGFIQNLNAQSPVMPTQYRRFNGVTVGTQNHDDIVITVCKAVVTGIPYAMSNGDFWIHNETIYETGLRYTKRRAKR